MNNLIVCVLFNNSYYFGTKGILYSMDTIFNVLIYTIFYYKIYQINSAFTNKQNCQSL